MSKWKNINQDRKYIPILLMLSIFLGCQEAPPNNAPEISELIIHPSQPKAGQIVLFTGIAEDIDVDPLTYKWMASGGTFLDSLGANPIQWQSPSESDSVMVYLQVSDGETTVTEAVSFFLENGVGVVAGHVSDMNTEYHLSDVVVNINGVEVVTGSDGYFRFDDVIAGENIPISAIATNYVTYASFIDVGVEENIVDISMTLLTEVGRVAGYVTDVSSGLKLAGVVVQTGNISDTTGTEGYYELYNVPNSENVPVRASLDGYNIHSSLINVTAGYNTNDIALEPNIATISGRVTSIEDDVLLEGVVVTVNQYEGITNSAGFYEIVDIPVTSNASVSASLEGYITSYSIIDIAGGANHLDLELDDNPGSLTGWVRSALDGSVLGNTSVQIGQNFFTTDITGAYAATGLETGTTLVTCTVQGFDTYTELVEINEGANTLDIELDPNIGTVTGFIRDSVAVSSLVGKLIQLGNQTTLSQTDGSFAFSNIPLGQHLLSVTLENYEDYSLVLDVLAGDNVQNIIMVPTTGKVLGIVRNSSTGAVVEGAEVSADNSSALTDEAGYFELPAVTRGSIHISCMAEFFIDSEEAITVEFGDNIHDISLQPSAGDIVGLVVDAAENTPLDGVLVTVGAMAETTDSTGTYTFANLELGSTQVEVSVDGYVGQSQLVDVQAGENTANFSLVADHGSLIGYITSDADSSPLSGVLVTAGSMSDTTGADGLYNITTLELGSIQVHTSAIGFVGQTQLVEIQVGENAANFSLVTDNGSLMGYVTDSDDMTPLDSARVILGTDTVMTDIDGYYLFESAIIGESLVLKTIRDDYYVFSDWIVLEAGENTRNITLNSNIGSLMGYITDSSTGAGLDSAQVILDTDTVRTDNSGYYEISGAVTGQNLVLNVLMADYEGYSDWIELDAGENVMDIALVADPATLMGFVRDAVSEALLDSVQIIFNTDTLMTEANGYYEFDPVLAGTADSLQVSRQGYTNQSQWLVLNPGANTVNFSLSEMD